MVTTIRLPNELHEKLKRQAGRKGMTFNSYILNLLWDMQECQAKKGAAGEKQESDKALLQAK